MESESSSWFSIRSASERTPTLGSSAIWGPTPLGNTASAVGGLRLPTLGSLGLGNIAPIEGVPSTFRPRAAFGRALATSAGKDTTSGHWEIMGVVVDQPLPTFPDGFSESIVGSLQQATGRSVIGNCAASGTEIIERLGEEHVRNGGLIVYTSADSVLQIAAHEELVTPETLYRYCELAREIVDPLRVGRVIARPFIGTAAEGFVRTSRRRDFSLPPPAPTVLDSLVDSGRPVIAIGKIEDIFASRGITTALHTADNAEGLERTIEALETLDHGLVFTNLVDFDVLYGHRRDPLGYARCLESFDAGLERLLARIRSRGDLLVITADHGNDPTMPGTDHTREQVPVLVYGEQAAGRDLGIRTTFADIGATVGEALGIEETSEGSSFLAGAELMAILVRELIQKKRDGGRLSDEEILEFIGSVAQETVPEYQIAAMLMAIFFRGLDDRELACWTDAMVHSGDVVDLSSIDRPRVDKHSTGGVGDKISLPLAPAAACCGVAVPMISGRGLGHSGGTLDKLESIPGFRVDLPPSEFISIVADVGLCLVGQTDRLAPARSRPVLPPRRHCDDRIDPADRLIDHGQEDRRRNRRIGARLQGRNRRPS